MYIDHILACANFYDQLASKHFNRSVKQVVLLHENDLAALFMGDLIEALATDGWQIISPLEAYEDDIAKSLPNTLHNGAGRIAAVLSEQGINPNSMVLTDQARDILKQRLLNLGLIPKSNHAKENTK